MLLYILSELVAILPGRRLKEMLQCYETCEEPYFIENERDIYCEYAIVIRDIPLCYRRLQ